jgi:hypothetical protein
VEATITGFALREAIKRFEMLRETASKQWNDSLFIFDGDKDKTLPEELMKNYREAERAVAALQTCQARFNIQVKVKVLNEEMTLAEAVKLVGGAGRMEKMWKSHATNTGTDRYSRSEMARSKDSDYAKRSISVKDCLKRATEAAKFAGAVRAAIAEGNSTKVSLSSISLDPKLLE